MVLLAAMPKASETPTTTKKPGFFKGLRMATRTSAATVSKTEVTFIFELPPGENRHVHKDPPRGWRRLSALAVGYRLLAYKTNEDENCSYLSWTEH